MTVSQPSSEIYVVDVPEVKTFTTQYYYNFFVPDESVNESGGVPANVITRSADQIDSDFVQYSVTRVPRFVQFQWSKPKLADVGNALSELMIRNNSNQVSSDQKGSLILDNIDKVVSEDDFSSNNFSSVHFHDGELDTKIHQMVSGTISQVSLEEDSDPNDGHFRATQRLTPMLPQYIKPHMIVRAMTTPVAAYGATFYVPPKSSATSGVRKGMFDPKQGVRVLNSFFERLHHVTTNVQINNKFMQDLVNRTIKDPTSTNPAAMVNMHVYSKAIKQTTNQRFSPALSESEFKTFVPFIEVRQYGSSPHKEKYDAEIVGYVIDKFEVLSNGSTKAHPPIIIDNPNVDVSIDYQVKFNAKYCYTIRTIALLRIQAIDDDSGNVATIKVLVSSKPSNKSYVSTLKLDAPPPPNDLNFNWNYETNPATNKPYGLCVTWAFPVTSERDVKQFQVFRRESIEHCFELQKVYNFDDSVVPFTPKEIPDPKLVERLSSPSTFWYDEEFDFDVNNSSQKGLIYSTCSVDAHGLTSNYSAQFRVWFDRFKNQLQKELVSHTGAPKPYPNMYLPATLFENTIRVRGQYTKKMRLFFNPEYYYLTDDENRYVKVLQTRQTGGSYKLQFINVDNLKSAVVNIDIDDRSSQTTDKLAQPFIRFGPKRRPLVRVEGLLPTCLK